MGYVSVGFAVMSFKIRWGTEKENRDSHYWCDACSGLSKDAFVIEKEMRGDWILCFKCMQDFQSTISPLSILVQTGKDTMKEKK